MIVQQCRSSSDPITNTALFTCVSCVVTNTAFAGRAKETENSNCDATINTDYGAAIGLNDKSSLQWICEMFEQRSRSLCATSTNAGFTFATAWIARSQLSLSCLMENVD